jgi:hypothetical protein
LSPVSAETREPGEGISLLSYGIVLVSMSLFFLHAVAIDDRVLTLSIPVRAARDLLVTNDVRGRSGTDRLAARATEHSTDEVCRGKAKI